MLLAKNRKAFFNHEIVEKLIAGIVLHGYEVKALKEGKVNFEGAYIKVDAGSAYVINLHIGRYSKQSQKPDDGEAIRQRLLLLNKNEIASLASHIHQKGKTAIPLALLLAHGLVKLELAIVKGRKKYENKHVEKEKQMKKDLQTQAKGLSRYFK
ncbi:MAG: SsrA-binding protein [candidate division WWE3 bacterium GW2011_GWA1_46_21]|uniref:SsrA-binding protein n=3 Tax=Katanobacteria TaxID=422282 RepID=A0A0G1PEW7_UNCKA|nr:MAG: SsrA-binding protein [candidate division WWE3 bacterium GW2011_GWA1_46_21]KKU50795.1 MAG: SsrA-binding protein [candidate division WWE3 bacterium GW2011_GWC1_47_10]KKU57573.1 MAG: SsrA-binding protein [candidate division WWE3 bacterium GW2011_GWB1_47_11]